MQRKILLFLVVAICLALPLPVNVVAKGTNTTRILVLNSYHKGFPWVDGIVEAVQSGLNAAQISYDLRVEYMDSKTTNYNAAYKKRLYDLYTFKYANLKFDAIISSDDHAFDFLREYHQSIFPDTPIVFCAVNNSNAANVIDPNYFTGVLETPDQVSMINLALKITPEIKSIYVVADRTPSGNYRWEKQTVPLGSSFPNIEFIRIDDSFSFEEIEEKLKHLPDDAITFYAVLTRDKTGKNFSLKEAVSRISDASTQPTYTFLSQDLQYGLVGGNVLDGYYQGEKATQIMLRILQGEHIATIPVEETPTSQFMFNYTLLEKYNIKLSDLPAESIILNRPLSFSEAHKRIAWATGLIVLLLFTVILMLYFNMRRKYLLEEALRKSEDTFKAIYEHAPVLINSFDTKGKCLLWNNECQKTFGWSMEEIDEHGDALSLFYPDPAIREDVIRAIATDPDAHFREWTPITKDGKTLNIMWANFRIPGGLTFSLGYNITERKIVKAQNKKLQEKLFQSQKMEAVGTLAGGIAHDFNNILSAIVGFTELAKDNPSTNKQLQEDLDEILSASNRAKNLIQQILTFSKKADKDVSQLHIPAIIQESIRLLRKTVPTSIEFKIDIDNEVGQVLADSTEIHQIVMNLCVNAWHAMEDTGGVLYITLLEFLPSKGFYQKNEGINEGKYLELIIQDTGKGIPPGIINSIFDPYFTTKNAGSGTGLGLAVTHGLVSEMGGVIEVESILGKGTSFSVYIPVSELNADTKNSKHTYNSSSRGNEHILFIDDEEQIRTLISRILTAQGYSVTTENNGQRGLERFLAHPDSFDLVISDINMPKISGDKLTRKILEIRPDILILLASGYNNNISRESAREIGAQDLLDKPISKETLLFKVRQLLDKKR